MVAAYLLFNEITFLLALFPGKGSLFIVVSFCTKSKKKKTILLFVKFLVSVCLLLNVAEYICKKHYAIW